MPLSEHEQRVLEQMEQALYAEDPRFAHGLVGKTRARANRAHAAVGVLGALLGLGLVILGVSMGQIWVGGLGFLLLVAGLAWAFTPRHGKPALGAVQDDGTVRLSRPGAGKQRNRTRRPPSHGGFMQRLEERWDRRREQGPF